MPAYVYSVKEPDGSDTQGWLEAESEEELIQLLHRQGKIILSVEPMRQVRGGRRGGEMALRLFGPKIRTQELALFTPEVSRFVGGSGARHGEVLLFVPGSTAALTIIEYESGMLQDLRAAIEGLAPQGIPYAHDARRGDGNGFAHVRAALLGPSVVIPFQEGRLLLGTWQQIVLLDFDNRPRQRRVLVRVRGERDG